MAGKIDTLGEKQFIFYREEKKVDLRANPMKQTEQQAIVAAIERLKQSGSDLMVRTQGASVIIPSMRLRCDDNKIMISGTEISITLDHHLQHATMIPINYGINQEDIDDGSSIVLVHGPDRELASISTVSAKQILNAVASITEEIEAITRTHDMIYLSEDLVNETMHPARKLGITVNGITLNGRTLVNWADINSVHLDTHILISHGSGEILTIAPGT